MKGGEALVKKIRRKTQLVKVKEHVEKKAVHIHHPLEETFGNN